MAFCHHPSDLPSPAVRTPMATANSAPVLFSTIAVLGLVALFLPGDRVRVADNSEGPKSVNPSPSPLPTLTPKPTTEPTPKPATQPTPDPTTEPTPTTEPRPTQAPIQ